MKLAIALIAVSLLRHTNALASECAKCQLYCQQSTNGYDVAKFACLNNRCWNVCNAQEDANAPQITPQQSLNGTGNATAVAQATAVTAVVEEHFSEKTAVVANGPPYLADKKPLYMRDRFIENVYPHYVLSRKGTNYCPDEFEPVEHMSECKVAADYMKEPDMSTFIFEYSSFSEAIKSWVAGWCAVPVNSGIPAGCFKHSGCDFFTPNCPKLVNEIIATGGSNAAVFHNSLCSGDDNWIERYSASNSGNIQLVCRLKCKEGVRQLGGCAESYAPPPEYPTITGSLARISSQTYWTPQERQWEVWKDKQYFDPQEKPNPEWDGWANIRDKVAEGKEEIDKISKEIADQKRKKKEGMGGYFGAPGAVPLFLQTKQQTETEQLTASQVEAGKAYVADIFDKLESMVDKYKHPVASFKNVVPPDTISKSDFSAQQPHYR